MTSRKEKATFTIGVFRGKAKGPAKGEVRRENVLSLIAGKASDVVAVLANQVVEGREIARGEDVMAGTCRRLYVLFFSEDNACRRATTTCNETKDKEKSNREENKSLTVEKEAV